MITFERLREVLRYDPKTGDFEWVKPGFGRRKRVGYHRPDGYIIIRIDGRNYQAGRLAWLWMTGKWPEHEADHRNRKRSDNRWRNLRDATRLQNANNRGLSRHNTSGVNGVSWHSRNRQWSVKLHQKHLGSFRTKAEAVAFVRRQA